MAKENKDFNNSSLILRNQELEEAEELEERKRREEEVHSLLSQAMGQFNFDEQSTINSSITSNEGDNSIIHINTSLREQYREGSLNNPLKTLYEVETVNKAIDKLKRDFNEQQNRFKKQVTLLEAENQQKSISLTKSQSLLVETTDQHMKLNEELTAQKNNISSLETKMKILYEENEVLRQLNIDLEKQKELRKFKENPEMVDKLRETIWKEATNQFQPQIASLHLEKQKLKEELDVLKKEKNRDFERTSSLDVQNKDLEDKLDELQSRYNELSSDMGIALVKLKQCIEEKNLLQDHQNQLLADGQLLTSLKLENEKLQKKNTSLNERAIQTSLPFVNHTEFTRVQDQLVTAHDNINKLENQIKLLQGRETLIKELQQKAAMFERIIQPKHKNRLNEMISVGVNTISQSDTSMLKVQYDTLLYQTKAKVHQKLKKDFDDKLVKAITEYNTLYNCKECKSLQEDMAKITEMRQQDRDAVVKLCNMWENKFNQFEKDVEREYLQLLNDKAESENTVTNLKKLLELYTEKHKKIEDYFDKHNEGQFESHKDKLVMQTAENYGVILKHLNRIKGKIHHCNKEMREAEKTHPDFAQL